MTKETSGNRTSKTNKVRKVPNPANAATTTTVVPENAAGGRKKHIPQRTCVVCRETNAKRTLTRIVRTADAGIQIDPTGKKNGRGAYLCSQVSCWKRATDSDVLEKALRTTLTSEDRQRLREAIPHISESGQQS